MPEEFDAIPDPRVPQPGEKPLSEAEMAVLPVLARQRLEYLEREYKDLQASYHRLSDSLRKKNWAYWSR